MRGVPDKLPTMFAEHFLFRSAEIADSQWIDSQLVPLTLATITIASSCTRKKRIETHLHAQSTIFKHLRSDFTYHCAERNVANGFLRNVDGDVRCHGNVRVHYY